MESTPTAPGSREDDLVTLGRRFLPVALVTAILLGYLVASLVPSSVLIGSSRADDTLAFDAGIAEFMPEGWAFFTRDPREPAVVPHGRDDAGQWVSAAPGPNAQLRYALGLDRTSRIQELELTPIVSGARAADWVECRGVDQTCIDAASVVALDNMVESPTLCGELALVEISAPPWAWSHLGDVEMPSRTVRVDVSCG